MSKEELYEQGKALHDQADYEAALEAFGAAIELDEADAELWYAVARASYQLKDYIQAAEAGQRAVELDEEHAAAWNGLGAALLAQGRGTEAMDAYRKAIRLGRSNPAPWTGLGAIYFQGLQQPQEGARYFHRAEHLGREAVAENCFHVFSQLPAYPFFSFRMIRSYMRPEQYSQWEDYLRQTFADAAPLKTYLAGLEAQVRQGQGPQEAQWLFGQGLLHLLMGDPAPALAYLDRSQALSPETDLMTAYYQLQACWDFVAPVSAYLKPALAKAETYLPPSQSGSWSFWKKKPEAPPLSPDDILPCYYAGLIFAENDEMDKSLQCFERIERDFLPAAYLAMWACEELVLPKKKKEKALYLLEQEAANPQFSIGLQPAELSLDAGDFPAQFLHTARYLELAEAIEQLHFFAEFEDSSLDLEVLGSTDNPPFHLLWSLREEDADRIQALLREDQARQAEAALMGAEEAGGPLSTAFQALQAAAERQGAEQAMADAIDAEQHDVAALSFFSLYFYGKKILTEENKFLIDCYALLKAHWPLEAPSVSLPAIRAGLKAIVDGEQGFMDDSDSEGAWPGFLSSAEARLAAGRWAEALLEWMEGEGADLTSYQEFKTAIQ